MLVVGDRNGRSDDEPWSSRRRASSCRATRSMPTPSSRAASCRCGRPGR